MKHPDKAIICGACLARVHSPTDPGPEDLISCPQCGASDTWDRVWAECMSEVADRFSRTGRPTKAANGEKPAFRWQFKD
jgi:hypothetical protein